MESVVSAERFMNISVKVNGASLDTLSKKQRVRNQ